MQRELILPELSESDSEMPKGKSCNVLKWNKVHSKIEAIPCPIPRGQ